jgi:integral membrane sensor domain MASE1
MGDQPVTRLLPAQTQNKHTQTSMPQVGFKHTISVFEQVRAVHALVHTATVVSSNISHNIKYPVFFIQFPQFVWVNARILP